MNWYIVKLKMQSASGTQWQSDTIFGHLCWALRYLKGEKALVDFLEWYENAMPLLLISNGFPGGVLPRPLLPILPSPTTISLIEQVKYFQQEKESKKIAYLFPQDFASVQSGGNFDPEIYKIAKDKENRITTRATLKNQLSRLTGTTGGEGQLFNFKEHFTDTVNIYLKIESGFEKTVEEIFKYLKDSGYGKRKSVGYGHIKDMAFDNFAGFNVPYDANGFVSLSNFVPAPNDPVKGSWKLLVKYGKLSESYATESNIFKKPLLMMEAGSTFYDSPCKEFYGRLINGLAKNHDQVVQYAFALPVPMKLPSL